MSDDSGKKIISHGKIYLAGNILQRCVSFVMLPIYTRCLTPADYGTIELLSMILDVVGIILGLRIGQAIFRFYTAYETKKDRSEIITTAIYMVLFLNLIGVSLLYLLSDYLTMAVFNDVAQKSNLILFSITLLMQGFIEIPMTYIRAKQRPWLFVSFSVFKLFLSLSLNILYVVWLNLHVSGVIYSAITSSLIMAMILSIFIVRDCGIRFSIQKAKKLVSFSFPLMLTSLITFFITFGDRFFLKKYIGLDEVGVYSLAYKFGFMLVFLIGSPFSATWDSEKFRIAKKENARDMFRDIFIYYSTLVTFVCIGVSLFVKDLLHIMAAPPFWGAAQIVPVVLAAYMVNIWGYYSNLGIFLKYKTIETTYGNLLAAIVITICYYSLIPKYGAMGAAWSTVIAFVTRGLWTYFRAKRLYNMGLKWRYTMILALLWPMAYGLSMISFNFNLFFSLTWNLMLLFVVMCIILFSPLLPKRIRIKLRRSLTNPKMLFSVN